MRNFSQTEKTLLNRILIAYKFKFAIMIQNGSPEINLMNATPRAPSTALIQVLLVGDDPCHHRLVTDLLDSVTARRFSIDWARTAIDAMDRLRQGRFDICLLDADLPDGDGLDLLASADALGLPLPVIVMADMPSNDQVRRALTLGAAACLGKGMLDPSTLERTIRFAIRQRQVTTGLARQAFRDEATGLISRALYRERLDRALAFARRRDREVAVIMIDLTLKGVHDHDYGRTDGVIAEAGRKLAADLRETDSIARLSERCLGLLIEGLRSLDQAAMVARKLLRCLRTTIAVEGDPIAVTPSLGIAIYPREGGDGDLLMRQAEAAMRRAIGEGPGGCRFASEHVDGEARASMVLERAFRLAFERRELRLRFHPDVCLTGRRNGFGGVIVWHHPDQGWLPLDHRLAETDDAVLIKGIADWALASAAEQLWAWRQEGLDQVRLALAFPFRRPPALRLLDQAIRDRLGTRSADAAGSLEAARPLDPERIELELHEDLIVEDARRGSPHLAGLKASGVNVALDGFGQGHLGIPDLRHDLLDRLKLAPSLCRDLPKDGPDDRLVRALVAFAHGLDLEVMAKGARDQRQFTFFKQLGCDAVQLCSIPPMSAEAATTWLKMMAKRPPIGTLGRAVASPEILIPKRMPQRTKAPPMSPD